MSTDPKDTNITVTVDTENLNGKNKNEKVRFSDDLGDPEKPGDPASYVSTVYKNQAVTWTARALNGSTVTIENIKKDGGKVIMADLRRGDGPNIYTANIVDGNDGDEESYSITIGLAGYQGIAGSNENGPIVFLGKTVAYMNSYQDDVWTTVAEAPFEIEGIAGHNTDGPIIYSGNRVAYMDGYKSNTWTELTPAPFKIEGIAGNNNSKGVLAYSGKRVAYLNYNSEKNWTEVSNAPFQIEGITGDYYGGPIVFSGNTLAYMNDYRNNGWNPIYEAPFQIEGIHGSYENGIVLYAGNQVAYLNGRLTTAGHFKSVANAPFIIEGIAGNAVNGPIVFGGPEVRYMPIKIQQSWFSVANMPFDTKTFTIDPRLKMKAIGTN